MILNSRCWTLLLQIVSALLLSHGALSQYDTKHPALVRSPYFNFCTKLVPTSFLASPISDLGDNPWQGVIRIDNANYQWFGPPIQGQSQNIQLSNFLDITSTPTRTVHTIQAGSMQLKLTLLSPIEDFLKQSIPLSYISLESTSIDGQSHSTQVFIGVSGEWISRTEGDGFSWSTVTTDSSMYHQYFKFSRSDSGQQNGTSQLIVGTSRPGPGQLTACTGNITNCATKFVQNGSFQPSDVSATPQTGSGLSAQTDTVYAFSTDLSDISQTSEPVVWCLGIVRNPTITYTDPSGRLQLRSPYFASQYSTISDVVDAFLSDYPNAVSRADQLDAKIFSDARNVSQSSALKNVLSFTAPVAMGATELTIANGTDGKWNTSDVKMFMKDLPDSNRINPVDKLYLAFPFYMYLNASYAGRLLAPLLEYQDSEMYTQQYAAMDLGTTYPNVTGNNGRHNQGVQMTGNMLIMALAHAQFSGDGSLIAQHYNLLKSWSDYLATFSLAPPQNQGSDTGSQALNSSDATLKGVLGVKAMSLISQTVGKADDAQHYSDTAASMVKSWQATQNLDASTSKWEQLYDLFADRLLQTRLVDDSVYDYQTQLVKRLAPSAPFGISMNSDSSLANGAWTSFTASVISDNDARDTAISGLYAHLNVSLDCPSLLYDNNGNSPVQKNGASSPALGAMYAPLALRLPQQSIVIPPSSPAETGSPSSPRRSIVGPVVGGVIGGLVLLAIIAGGVVLWLRKRSKDDWEPPMFVPDLAINPPTDMVSMPYAGGVVIQSKLTQAAPAHESLPMLSPEAASSSQQLGAEHLAPEPEPAPAPAPIPRTAARAVDGLRSEMENLRNVVQTLRANRTDLPPEYTE
ncbi:unnamed protein product [Somion occarium]|uniref:DUF1793-domain-containing protein n=1 Tax=Somion occarium TaxID=3059160 RepID=A0ABP1E5M4_9APHY